jgi:hypothetical protein
MKTPPKKGLLAKLLVEGTNDQHVIWAICQKHGIPETFDVIDCKGITEILSRISTDLKGEGITAIGVIVDADENLQNRWKSLVDRLDLIGYKLPKQPDPDGTIHAAQGIYPRVGFWIMPNNETDGKIEDFIEYLIKPDDYLLPIAQNVLTEVELTESESRYKEKDRQKALIHTWLAWQKNPGRPMGQAITNTYLDHNADLCLRFVNWLNRLYNPSDSE